MRNKITPLAIILGCFLVTSAPLAVPPHVLTDKNASSYVQGEDAGDSLRAYLKRVGGTWIEPGNASPNGDYRLQIEIDPSRIEHNQAKIYVSEYCQHGIADYLHFELKNNQLEYAGASDRFGDFDICRLEFIHLRDTLIPGQHLLLYEALETEHAHEVYKQLVKVVPTL